MRETEMRRRSNAVLKTPLHRLLLPTLGLGLAVGACSDPTPVYGAQMPPDANGVDVVVRDVAVTLDTAVDGGGGLDAAVPVDAPLPMDSSRPIDGQGSE